MAEEAESLMPLPELIEIVPFSKEQLRSFQWLLGPKSYSKPRGPRGGTMATGQRLVWPSRVAPHTALHRVCRSEVHVLRFQLHVSFREGKSSTGMPNRLQIKNIFMNR